MKSHIRNLYNLLFSIISHGCGKSKFVLMINLDNCDSWLKVGISRKNYLETCWRKRKTLPKAQRTRGLSSSWQSNFWGHITSSNTNLDHISSTLNLQLKILTKPSFRISTKHFLQNLNQTSPSRLNLKFKILTTLTSKSQPNISISSQTNCREISDGVSESVSDKGSQCWQLN